MEWEYFKNDKNESFESVITRVIISSAKEDAELLTDEDVLEIEQDIKEGKYYTSDQIKAEFGLK